MKKLIIFALSLFLIISSFFWTACSKTDEEEEAWSSDEQEAYAELLNLQDEIANNLDTWFLSMDSLDAINLAQQSFANAPSVTEATINNKGIAVQYANGMRGGLFLKGKLFDYKKSTALNPLADDIREASNLKSIVNGRRMLQLDAAYSQFSYYTDQVHNINNSNLSRVGISITDYYKDSEVTVDRLTQLGDYGIIDMSGHGIAWPKESYISEIYFLTGETVNANTSKKYWDEIKTGSIPLVKTMSFTSGTKYCISPDFITSHNDFSNDTILFYGGFCFSFLGDWPDIINDFGDGAYLGFDWSVQGFHCANWDINSLAMMSDTSKSQALNLEGWMNDGNVAKSYNEEGRIVSIHYTGDGNLCLWGNVSVNLIPLSSDGTPVSNPGEAGVAYPFKCEVVSNISELEYIWDIGDGSSPVTASNAVNITWSEDGEYELKVEVKDKSNGNSVGSAKSIVTIGNSGEDELIDILKACNHVYLGFGPEDAFLWEEGKTVNPVKDPGDLEWEEAVIVWNGLSFSATAVTNENHNHTINGILSSDGFTVTAIGEQVGYEAAHDFYYKLGFDNYPVQLPYDNTTVIYTVESNQIQNYVTTFEGRWVWDNGNIINFTGVDWENTERLYIVFRNLVKSTKQTDSAVSDIQEPMDVKGK